LVTGGSGGLILSTTEILTVGTSSWRLVGSLPVALGGLNNAALSVDNTIILTGGYTNTRTHSDKILRFDTKKNVCIEIGSMQTERGSHAVSLVDVKDFEKFCLKM